MKGDFHMHTQYSDGTFSVKEVLKMASGLDYIAITDHDILTGALEAYQEQLDTKVIVGLELSTINNNESVHILGYFSDLSKIDHLNSFLEKQRLQRQHRAHQIKDLLLEHFRIDLNMDFAKTIDSITRGSIANQIIEQGFPYTKEEIFKKMIGEGCLAYIPSTKITTNYGIKLIKQYNGLAVLAHPVLLKKNDVFDFIDMGLDGLEAFYPANSEEDTQKLLKIAKDGNLIVTAGSDFHTMNDYKHGNIGQVCLEGEYLELFLRKLDVK